MKILALVILQAVFSIGVAAAQNPLNDYLSSPDGRQLDCRFSYVIPGSVPLTGSGSVWMSGDCFRVETNGILVLCDGVSRWTVDEEAGEVYVESAEDIRNFLDNPSLLLRELESVRYSGGNLSGIYLYDDKTVELTFTSMKVSPSSNEKPFNPQEELKGYESKGFVLTDLR